jgi:hypothetical protein
MAGDFGCSVPGDDEKAVGPFYEPGFPVVPEQLYGGFGRFSRMD